MPSHAAKSLSVARFGSAKRLSRAGSVDAFRWRGEAPQTSSPNQLRSAVNPLPEESPRRRRVSSPSSSSPSSSSSVTEGEAACEGVSTSPATTTPCGVEDSADAWLVSEAGGALGAEGKEATCAGALVDGYEVFSNSGEGEAVSRPVNLAKAARNRLHMRDVCPSLAHQQGNPDYIQVPERTPRL